MLFSGLYNCELVGVRFMCISCLFPLLRAGSTYLAPIVEVKQYMGFSGVT